MSAEDIAAAVKDDHAGHAAIADLLRNAGLVHARLGNALAHGRRGISAPHAYVGLHIREQKKNGRRLSITLAALIPDGDQWAAWGYAWSPHPVTRKTGWMRYTDAAVAHRASDLIRGSRHTMWDEGVADMINIALDQLAGQLRGIPYVLMVPGEGSRTIWPGLANRHLGLPTDPAGRVNGKLPLPGPARTPPAAVVRVTPMPGGIRPVPGAANPKAPKTTNALYEHDQTSGDTILVLSTSQGNTTEAQAVAASAATTSAGQPRPQNSPSPGTPTRPRSSWCAERPKGRRSAMASLRRVCATTPSPGTGGPATPLLAPCQADGPRSPRVPPNDRPRRGRSRRPGRR